MLKVYLFVVLSLLIRQPSLAKLSIPDLLNRSENRQVDTLTVNHLNQQCWSLRRTDPLSAITIGKESLEMAKEVEYAKGEAQILNYLGICYLRLNDSPTATEYFYKALLFSDSLNIDVEKGYALNNIASSLMAEGENRQALIFARKALTLQTQNKDKKGIAYAMIRLSDVYRNLQQNDSLLIAAQTAYKLLIELGMKENSLIALKNIGRAWEGEKQYDKALKCYLEIVNSISISKSTERNVYVDLARIYNLLKLPEQAIFYGERWLAAEKGNELILKQMANSYALKDDWKKAFRFAQMRMAVMDSIAKEEKLSQIKNLQILYATREKEKENVNLKAKLNIRNLFVLALSIIIILIGLLLLILQSKKNQQIRLNKLLNQQNEEISIQRDHLKELNQTKDKLFSIIAHDLRGPIGSTYTFLELLALRESDFTKKELLENLALLKDSSKATFKLLENLLTWARAQRGEIVFNPLQINLFNLVKSNIDLFLSTAENKKIIIANEIDPDLIFEFDQEMINTVIRNLISNAVKYTSADGIVTISAKEIDDSVEINIKDTGIGMDSETAGILFVTNPNRTRKEGTKGEKGTGLGLILCNEFIRKHGGNIWVESKPGKGSTFKFSLPRSHPVKEVI
ncbi:MAG: ATP-binding protein [Bacteroidia bacterium]|nr:ATP-binding protein [Bacteroidia bacterium]